MTDASFADRMGEHRVIDRRTVLPWGLAYWRFQRAALEARQSIQASHMPDPGPWWRQPLPVCLVSYAFALMALVVLL
jgi:hypothetical protein